MNGCSSGGEGSESEDSCSVLTEPIPFDVARSAIRRALLSDDGKSGPWVSKGIGGLVPGEPPVIQVYVARRGRTGWSPSPDSLTWGPGSQRALSRPCHCWKRPFMGCERCEARVYRTWPQGLPPPFRPPSILTMRLVMEEAERKEEQERWRERGGVVQHIAPNIVRQTSANDTATLPIKRSWQQPNGREVTTTAILEGARNVSSNNIPSLNGLHRGQTDGLERPGDQADLDDKPPNLVVNLSQSDKASQVPEPLPPTTSQTDISKKADEADGHPEPENSCLVDCLYVTLQCCDCSIM